MAATGEGQRQPVRSWLAARAERIARWLSRSSGPNAVADDLEDAPDVEERSDGVPVPDVDADREAAWLVQIEYLLDCWTSEDRWDRITERRTFGRRSQSIVQSTFDVDLPPLAGAASLRKVRFPIGLYPKQRLPDMRITERHGAPVQRVRHEDASALWANALVARLDRDIRDRVDALVEPGAVELSDAVTGTAAQLADALKWDGHRALVPRVIAIFEGDPESSLTLLVELWNEIAEIRQANAEMLQGAVPLEPEERAFAEARVEWADLILRSATWWDELECFCGSSPVLAEVRRSSLLTNEATTLCLEVEYSQVWRSPYVLAQLSPRSDKKSTRLILGQIHRARRWALVRATRFRNLVLGVATSLLLLKDQTVRAMLWAGVTGTPVKIGTPNVDAAKSFFLMLETPVDVGVSRFYWEANERVPPKPVSRPLLPEHRVLSSSELSPNDRPTNTKAVVEMQLARSRELLAMAGLAFLLAVFSGYFYRNPVIDSVFRGVPIIASSAPAEPPVTSTTLRAQTPGVPTVIAPRCGTEIGARVAAAVAVVTPPQVAVAKPSYPEFIATRQLAAALGSFLIGAPGIALSIYMGQVSDYGGYLARGVRRLVAVGGFLGVFSGFCMAALLPEDIGVYRFVLMWTSIINLWGGLTAIGILLPWDLSGGPLGRRRLKKAVEAKEKGTRTNAQKQLGSPLDARYRQRRMAFFGAVASALVVNLWIGLLRVPRSTEILQVRDVDGNVTVPASIVAHCPLAVVVRRLVHFPYGEITPPGWWIATIAVVALLSLGAAGATLLGARERAEQVLDVVPWDPPPHARQLQPVQPGA